MSSASSHPGPSDLGPGVESALALGRGRLAPPSEEAADLGSARPCLGCGYDMRGLPLEGTCPECRRPVRASVDPELGSLATGDRSPSAALACAALGVGAVATGPLMVATGLMSTRSTGAFDTIAALAPLRAAADVIRGAGDSGTAAAFAPVTGWSPLLADTALLAWIVGLPGLAAIGYGLAFFANPQEGDDGPGDADLQRRAMLAFGAIAGLLLVLLLPASLREPLLEPAGLAAIATCVAAWMGPARRVARIAAATETSAVVVSLDRHRRAIRWLVGFALWLFLARVILVPFVGWDFIAGVRRGLALECAVVLAAAGAVLSWTGLHQIRFAARGLHLARRLTAG